MEQSDSFVLRKRAEGDLLSAKVIREAEIENELDVNDCLDIMNTVSARKYKNTKRLTEITKIAGTVCETMRIEIPEEIR